MVLYVIFVGFLIDVMVCNRSNITQVVIQVYVQIT